MKKKRLGYLGPRGTFSEEAALLYNQDSDSILLEYPSIADVVTAVKEGSIDEGLVPLENTLEGGVGPTLDRLARQEEVYICNELVYPVHQCLMSAEKLDLNQIRQVLSHPHALGQCSEYLNRNLSHAECLPVESTAAAAKAVRNLPGAAAIAPSRAGELFNLVLLARDIQDNNGNATRFVVVARHDHAATGEDKTSLVLSIPDGPGSLYHVLGYFAHRNINLTRIESRPSRQMIGDWLFFIDCEGHRNDPGREELWAEIEQAVPFFKLLGSYPVNRRRADFKE